MTHTSGFFMASASVWLMVLVIVLAHIDEMLLPWQFTKHYNVGFPLVANGAIWGNLVLLSIALYFIGSYAWQWDGKEIGAALVLGLVVSYSLFHFVYLKGMFPDALAGGGRPISPAGWVVVLYSGLVYGVIVLFYLRTSATPADILIIGGLLLLYVPVANHAVLGWLNGLYSWPWCPRIFAEEATPLRFIIGGEVLVVVATAVKLLL